jgi:Flp pilus assembly protein TadG
MRSFIARLIPSQVARLARDQEGVSAVEFAMLLPLMLTLYLGGVEVSQGISIDRKVTLTARTVADLTAQVSSINSSGLTSVLNASTAVLAPYPEGPAKVVVSLVTIDAQGVAKITWSQAKNTTARATGSVVTIPSALKVNNTALVWGEVSYTYTPSIGYVVSGSLNLKDQIFMRPRLSDTITKT